MKYEILKSSLTLLPISKGCKLLEEYQKNVGFKNFAEQQEALDIMTYKVDTKRRIKEEVFENMLFCLALMVNGNSRFSKEAFKQIKGYPMIFWMESIGAMGPRDILKLLENFGSEFPSTIIETCIINLDDDMQRDVTRKYLNRLDVNSISFSNFYYTVSEETRDFLREKFPDKIGDDILLELEDLDEAEVFSKLSSEKQRISKQDPDALIRFILLKTSSPEVLNRFFLLYQDVVNKCSIQKFFLLFNRYKQLKYGGRFLPSVNLFDYEDDEDDEKEEKGPFLNDEKLFTLFKDKFREMGIRDTLSLFGYSTKYYYTVNENAIKIILEFRDIAYYDEEMYINKKTLRKLIQLFSDKCFSKEYSEKEFETFVGSLGTGREKLFSDDYIEATIACGNLLKRNVINNKSPLFLELRRKFVSYIVGRCKKDGTFQDEVSLNGLFYRLAMGKVPFENVLLTETYKGLIYLSKCSRIDDSTDADYITTHMTDELMAKLNINPVIKWKDSIVRPNSNADNELFVIKMGLELFSYFGIDRGRYLLESSLAGNVMENLFDGLGFDKVEVDHHGFPKVNKDLIDFLFGTGMMREKNSIINKMIRGELPEFKKYFTEFCNSFDVIKLACHGVVTVKRVVKYFENVKLPIELKPDEVEFSKVLMEMNTLDEKTLSKGLELCKDVRQRRFSTIPKVEGKMGEFTYKILDVDDAFALAVGYLSHCCFVVNGDSYSALKHSMQSINGRTFVVYYKGNFLCQSWVWRNGDVICFDSVEAGSDRHFAYDDEIHLVDVYKSAALEMLNISWETEDDIQRVKVVTVGRQDYTFKGLTPIKRPVPSPLEDNLYVYDSREQSILAGEMPKNPRYGVVGVQYRDPVIPVRIIDIGNTTDADLLDEVSSAVDSLKYQIYKDDVPMVYTNYKKILLGKNWYILIANDGAIESGATCDEEAIQEYKKYLSQFSKTADGFGDNEPQGYVLRPLNKYRK